MAMRWVQVLCGPDGDTVAERIGSTADEPEPVVSVIDTERPGRGDVYVITGADEAADERVAWYQWVAHVDDLLTTDEAAAAAVAERIATTVAPWCLGKALTLVGRDLTSRRNTRLRPE